MTSHGKQNILFSLWSYHPKVQKTEITSHAIVFFKKRAPHCLFKMQTTRDIFLMDFHLRIIFCRNSKKTRPCTHCQPEVDPVKLSKVWFFKEYSIPFSRNQRWYKSFRKNVHAYLVLSSTHCKDLFPPLAVPSEALFPGLHLLCSLQRGRPTLPVNVEDERNVQAF